MIVLQCDSVIGRILLTAIKYVWQFQCECQKKSGSNSMHGHGRPQKFLRVGEEGGGGKHKKVPHNAKKNIQKKVVKRSPHEEKGPPEGEKHSKRFPYGENVAEMPLI